MSFSFLVPISLSRCKAEGTQFLSLGRFKMLATFLYIRQNGCACCAMADCAKLLKSACPVCHFPYGLLGCFPSFLATHLSHIKPLVSVQNSAACIIYLAHCSCSLYVSFLSLPGFAACFIFNFNFMFFTSQISYHVLFTWIFPSDDLLLLFQQTLLLFYFLYFPLCLKCLTICICLSISLLFLSPLRSMLKLFLFFKN